MHKFLFLTILASSLHVIAGNDSSIESDPKFYLAGNSSKSWYIYSVYPEDENSCKISDPVSADNIYTFFSDGTFEFNHGSLTGDSTCEKNCCIDLVNMVGKWKFINDNRKIKVWSLSEKGNSKNDIKAVLFENNNIDHLDEDVLRFTQLNPETNETSICEFRKR